MDQSDLLKQAARNFDSLKISYFVTGSMASILYGEPRLTNDIDIVADIKEKHISGLLDLYPQDEFYISEEAIRAAIAQKKQFNIIHPDSGLKLDIIVRKDTEFDNNRFNRAKKMPVEELKVSFSSPEDVIIMKMKFYKEGASEKHLRDITGMLQISGNIIDKKYIENWSNKLKLSEIWSAILEKLGDKDC